MSIIVNLELNDIDTLVKQEMEEIWKEAQEGVKARTPELSWDLVDAIELSEVKKSNTWYEIEVFTDLEKIPYAEIVEDWVEWKTYTYSKPKWNTLREWVWAKMYEQVALIYERINIF